ncbi:MAG: hypothetical protein KAU01_07770 [Candidatus Cloacimonetes bacterium]|nr:hypothetical protein [Candidatus Cloacimonadota bacterium]
MEKKEIKIINRLIKKKISRMKKSIPKIVDPMKFGIHSKTHFKAQEFKELTLLRIIDISESAFVLYKKKKIIPALLLTRASIETLSIFYYMYNEVDKVIKAEKINNNFITKLDRLLLGNKFDRSEENSFDPINIMDCIRILDTVAKGTNKQYDFLSEFCHPNEFGLLNGYSTMNKEKIYSELDITHLEGKFPHYFGIKILLICLEIYNKFYNNTDKMIKKLSILTKEEK